MVDETEEEQVEAIKKWWAENGTSTVVSVVLALGAVFGYQAWETGVREAGESASQVYEDMLQASTNVVPGSEDTSMATTALSLASDLKINHTDSTYAVFAALHSAKIAVEADDLDTAVSEFKWILEQGTEAPLERLVRMRLARVLLAQGNSDAALSTLDDEDPDKAQLSSWEEVRGDIYLAVGERQKARESYQLALENLPEEGGKPLLEIKLADISLGGEQPAVGDQVESGQVENDLVEDDSLEDEFGEVENDA